MKSNKPEVLAWRWQKPIVNDKGETIGVTDWVLGETPEFLPWWTNDPLVSLSDYKALQSECDALLARVRELEKTMAAIREASGCRWMNGISDHKLLSDIEKMTERVTQTAELERQSAYGGSYDNQ